jgi:uncharacterized membrane protein
MNAKNHVQRIVLRVKCLAKIVATIVIVHGPVVNPAHRVESSVCGNVNIMSAPNDVVRCVIGRNAMNHAVNL